MTEKKPAATEVTTSRRDAADSTGHQPEQLSFLPARFISEALSLKGAAQ